MSLTLASHLDCNLLPRHCWALHQAGGTGKQGEQTLAVWHSCSRIIKTSVFLLSLSANRPGTEQISRADWLDEPEEGSGLAGLPRALQQGPVPAPRRHRMMQRELELLLPELCSLQSSRKGCTSLVLLLGWHCGHQQSALLF